MTRSGSTSLRMALHLGPERARFQIVTALRRRFSSEGRRWKPVTSMWWKGYPAWVTRRYSIPSLRPAKWISAAGSAARSAPAMARAGLIWPAVPPAAINTRMIDSSCPGVPDRAKNPVRLGLQAGYKLFCCTPRSVQTSGAAAAGPADAVQSDGRAGRLPGLFLLGFARGAADRRHLRAVAPDVDHDAHLGHEQQQTGAARGEEGQADAGVGQGVGDDGHVAEHLPAHLGHDAHAHQRAEAVPR